MIFRKNKSGLDRAVVWNLVNKTLKVVVSCNNFDQLEVAKTYSELVIKSFLKKAKSKEQKFVDKIEMAIKECATYTADVMEFTGTSFRHYDIDYLTAKAMCDEDCHD